MKPKVFKLSLFVLFVSMFQITIHSNEFESYLPIITINTNGSSIVDEPKIMATMGIIYNGPGKLNQLSDTQNNYCGLIGIEVRGQSSQWFEKKSYAIETRNADSSNLSVSLLGLPKENDWVLIASYADKSLIRNPLAYDLGRKMRILSTRTVFCEVFINNDYQGVYYLGEKIKRDKNRVNIAKPGSTADSITGGYIIKIDKGYIAGVNGWKSNYTSNGHEIDFLYHDPDENEISAKQKLYIKAYIDSFEQKLYQKDFSENTGYKRFIDINSFINYFLISELTRNIDAYRISTYFYKDRANRNGKLFMGPMWDYDLALGNAYYMDGWKPEGWIFCPNNDGWQIPFWWKNFDGDSSYVNLKKCTWEKFRKGVLSDDAIGTTIDSLAMLVTDAALRNSEKWYIGQIWENEVANVKKWTQDRLAWMDENMPGTCATSNSNDIVPNYAKDNISVFPNPFIDRLNISINNTSANNYQISIVDLSNRTIFSKHIFVPQQGPSTFRFGDEIGLAKGVYLIKVSNPYGFIYNQKIIKK